MVEPIPTTVDVYPVGVLAELLRLRNALRYRRPEAIRWALGRVRGEVRFIAEDARVGNWRAVRNAVGGYHAEHRDFGLRCGTGWTKRRAVRDLYRDLAELGVRRAGR